MPRPKFRPVSPDEVKITRNGDTAIFTYADQKTMGGGMNLKVGDKIHGMTDAELLQMHNDMAEGMIADRQRYESVAVEVPVGKPQIEFDKQFDHWSMRGDVLRCYVAHDSDNHGLPMIEVDDKKLTWDDFGRMLMTYEGCGCLWHGRQPGGGL